MIEWGEVYAKEGAQLAPSIAPPVEETSLFAGSLMALPQGVKHGWDVAASAMANAAMPVLEKVTPDSMTAWLDDQRRVANESMKATRTDPRTMGTVGQIGHAVSSILTMGAMGGVAMGPVGAAGAIGGLSMFQSATDMLEQGVDLQTAQKVGAVTGAVMGVGATIPILIGSTLAKQVAAGIATNVSLGAVLRGATGEILEDKYAGIAQHYKALDGTAIAIDAVLGAAFPIGARLLRKPSVAQIDDAQDANRVVAEQSRDPALQATLEGIERHREIADDVTRQILEENRPLGDIEIPANAMDDVVPNEQFGQTAAVAAKAIDDLMIQESGMGVGQVEADISTLARAFNPAPREMAVDGVATAMGDPVKFDITFSRGGVSGTALDGAVLIGEGSESTVYRRGDVVIKVAEPYSDKSDATYLARVNSALLTDQLVGSGTLRHTGYYESANGTKNPVFEQAFVEGRSATKQEIQAHMESRGFSVAQEGKYGDTYTKIGEDEVIITVRDLDADNVRFDESGNVQVIDASITFKNSDGTVATTPLVDKPKVGSDTTAKLETEASPDQFTKQAARGIIESDPTMTVMDENGNAVVAKDLLDQAETKFQQETKEADLFKVAVACAIGVGE